MTEAQEQPKSSVQNESKVELQKVFHPIISPHGIVYSLHLESTTLIYVINVQARTTINEIPFSKANLFFIKFIHSLEGISI